MKQLYALFATFIFASVFLSCKNNSYADLLPRTTDSIYAWEKSKLEKAPQYEYYLIATSKDTSLHTEQSAQAAIDISKTYYPWKVKLSKQVTDAFLATLAKDLKADKDFKSSFGELPDISAAYTPIAENTAMAELMTCRLTKYNLTNSKGEKLSFDNDFVGIANNMGHISLNIAKWDLQGQKIKGEVTLELTIPYQIYGIEVKQGDRSKTFNFGSTKITILERENNAFHYSVLDDAAYQTKIWNESCMGENYHTAYPQHLYDKFRAKPDVSYQQFVGDLQYFELNRKPKPDTKKVRVVYFHSCAPETIYLFGYKRTAVSKRLITVPIDVLVNMPTN